MEIRAAEHTDWHAAPPPPPEDEQTPDRGPAPTSTDRHRAALKASVEPQGGVRRTSAGVGVGATSCQLCATDLLSEFAAEELVERNTHAEVRGRS